MTQADMIMMQQDVAGSLRVSLKSSLSILSPMTGGFQEVDGSPRNWIPASAGMTEDGAAECCRGLGCPQILHSSPQDWGTKGVENE